MFLFFVLLLHTTTQVQNTVENHCLQITILLDESLIDELRGWLTVNNGEIIKVKKPRKTSSTPGKFSPTKK